MKRIRILFLSLMLLPCFVQEAPAQCPMCKMAAESNLKAGGTAGKGLNRGILYMLVMPYLLVGTMAYLWWRNRQQHDEFEEAQA